MEKKDLIAALKKAAQGAEVITRTQLMNFFNIQKYDHIKKYIRKLDSIDGKYFLISDVARELIGRVK